VRRRRATGAGADRAQTARRRSGDPVKACESLKTLTLAEHDHRVGGGRCGQSDTRRRAAVTALVTHPPANDKVTVGSRCPSKGLERTVSGRRRRRFSGGSAMGAAGPLRAGYAAGSTDTGHTGASGSFALDANGSWTGRASATTPISASTT
jgi:hypothetical protein